MSQSQIMAWFLMIMYFMMTCFSVKEQVVWIRSLGAPGYKQ